MDRGVWFGSNDNSWKTGSVNESGGNFTFDEYWEDSRFKNKHPVFNKGMMHMYGDNIYHHSQNKWAQDPSHHSNIDGSINYKNLNQDTKADKVLVATEYYYFGNNAIKIPAEYNALIWNRRNHKVCCDEILISSFIDYIRCNYSTGISGTPYSRKAGEFVHYGGEK